MKDREIKDFDEFKGLGNYNNKNLSREDILYPTMKEKKDYKIPTYQNSSIVTDEISGVKKGKPMNIEDAIKDVNPNFDIFGNITYKQNCQAGVIVADARVRGFDLNVDIEYESEFKTLISQRPNIAYIDPVTGGIPEFTNITASNDVECETFLNNTIKPNERYLFGFTWKSSTNKKTDHIVIAVRDKNNEIKFYDPQNKSINGALLLKKIMYKNNRNEDICAPQILRIDDKELNYKILNRISKPAEKKKIRYYIPKNN